MSSNIIRFDHISRVVSRDVNVDSSYKFREMQIKNTQGRFGFMDTPFQDIDMYFYDRTFPVEVVAYDRVEKFTDIRVKDDRICCKVGKDVCADVSEAFKIIGFKEQTPLLWNISGTLDRSKVYLELETVENTDTLPINWGGVNCPCFLVKDVHSVFEKMEDKKNIKVSSIDPLTVNNRVLDVGFMGIYGFELAFEFISMRRNLRR